MARTLSSSVPRSGTQEMSREETWSALLPVLEPFARYVVYSQRVPSWRGQEGDIAGDIVQETARRLYERTRKAECGNATPVQSLKHMMTTIAQNYGRDLRRHDYRLTRIQPAENHRRAAPDISPFDQASFIDLATENVFNETLFQLIAQAIADFPIKQRTALCIDLANRMSFDGPPTQLQAAFLRAGIALEHYRQPLPEDPKERSRHVSLLTHAYKRLALLPCIQQYIAETSN